MDKQTTLNALHGLYNAVRRMHLQADEHDQLRKYAIQIETFIEQQTIPKEKQENDVERVDHNIDTKKASK